MILKSPGTWYLILNHSSVYIWAWAYFTEWTLSLAGCFYDQLNRVDETAKLSCWHSFLFSRYIMVAADSWPTRKRDLEIVSALWLSKGLNFGQWNTVKLIVCRKCCQKWHQRHCWNWYPWRTVYWKLNWSASNIRSCTDSKWLRVTSDKIKWIKVTPGQLWKKFSWLNMTLDESNL